MKVEEIIAILNNFCDKKLSDEFVKKENSYDNSGLIINTGKEIDSVTFSLDFSSLAVDEAIKNKSQALITHHPAIFNKIANIDLNNSQGRNIIKCIEYGISVYSMHLNLDVATYGIDYFLAKTFSDKKQEIIIDLNLNEGYGRKTEVDCTLFDLADKFKEASNSDKIFVYGENRRVKTVASFCGSGSEYFYKAKDVDVLISADIKHHLIAEALDNGQSVLQVGHYPCENIGFKKNYNIIKSGLFSKLKTFYFEDKKLL